FFFFNDTATTEIYTLSLHDALPILAEHCAGVAGVVQPIHTLLMGSMTPACVMVSTIGKLRRVMSVLRKKNSLFLTMGPPKVAPTWLRSSYGIMALKGSRASRAVLRKNQKPVP